jgi:hypothetical protein
MFIRQFLSVFTCNYDGPVAKGQVCPLTIAPPRVTCVELMTPVTLTSKYHK